MDSYALLFRRERDFPYAYAMLVFPLDNYLHFLFFYFIFNGENDWFENHCQYPLYLIFFFFAPSYKLFYYTW